MRRVIEAIVPTARIVELKSTLPAEELRKRVKVVVIDDDEDHFPTEDLKSMGYSIDWWPIVDVNRLRRLETGDFDIVILDIQGVAEKGLSDTGDGLGILRRIKEVSPYQVVVAFSGKKYDLAAVPFWRLADDALTKPVTMIECEQLLDRLITQHVSISSYWEGVRALLRQEGVGWIRQRALERLLVSRVKRGSTIATDDIRDAIGAVNALEVVFKWVQRIVSISTLT